MGFLLCGLNYAVCTWIEANVSWSDAVYIFLSFLLLKKKENLECRLRLSATLKFVQAKYFGTFFCFIFMYQTVNCRAVITVKARVCSMKDGITCVLHCERQHGEVSWEIVLGVSLMFSES